MSTEGDELETGAVDEALDLLRKTRARMVAMRRLLEQSMDAPGGLEWEHQVSAPELEEETEAPLLKTRAQEERERRWREEFTKNWPPDKPPRK